MQKNITNTITLIGINDRDIDLFESQYIVPNGISYNSYIVFDEKVAVLDTCDNRKIDEWFEELQQSLQGRTPDYLIVTHMEPDHAAGVAKFAEAYPEATIVGNAKTFAMISQFFALDISARSKVVAEGETLDLGGHILRFIMAAMVHWPEVMVVYDEQDKVLFSADGFGKFGALDCDEDWACEARRYYFNIVGKYGANVQQLLKKLAGIEINAIAPLHGPVLLENLDYYVGLYDTWSKYQPETEGVFVAYASIHGNTAKVALELVQMLKKAGHKVSCSDLCRDDQAEAVEDAFKYSTLVVAASTYDAGICPPMEHFLHHLKSKNYQNRRVGIIENGSWAPTAGKHMSALF